MFLTEDGLLVGGASWPRTGRRAFLYYASHVVASDAVWAGECRHYYTASAVGWRLNWLTDGFLGRRIFLNKYPLLIVGTNLYAISRVLHAVCG
jgi:hypothetical protein